MLQNEPLCEDTAERAEAPTDATAEKASEAAEEQKAAEKSAEDADTINYAALAEADLAALKAQFPALEGITSLTMLDHPVRYGELRELGLSPKEAYLATGGHVRKKSDNRSHLYSAVPRASAAALGLPSAKEMEDARRLFSDLSDAQIHRLYKKVTN